MNKYNNNNNNNNQSNYFDVVTMLRIGHYQYNMPDKKYNIPIIVNDNNRIWCTIIA